MPSVAPAWALPVCRHNYAEARKLSPAVRSTRQVIRDPPPEQAHGLRLRSRVMVSQGRCEKVRDNVDVDITVHSQVYL